jgi:hypothetical protein
MDVQVQAIVNSLTGIVVPVTQNQIPSIIVAALAATASMTTLSTTDKEQVIIGVVQYYITRSNIPINEQTVIMNLVPGILAGLLNLPQTKASCDVFWVSFANWFKTNCKCCCTGCCK